MAISPEAAGRWLRLVLVGGWAMVLLLMLCATADSVQRRGAGLMTLALLGGTCAWLRIVLELLPTWRIRRPPR